jgi:YD repeat-containing protein
MAKTGRDFGGKTVWRDWDAYDRRVAETAKKARAKRVARYEKAQARKAEVEAMRRK